MTRIVYVSPDSNVPTGGIKVIYRHAELLRRMRVDAHVMHFQAGFRVDWFEHDASVISINDLRPTDLVIVPEIMTIFGNQLHAIGVRYAMFVQNGYLVLPTAPMAEVQRCYQNAAAILSISEDTSGFIASVFPEFAEKILRVKYSVDAERFAPGPKSKRATFMPRKLPLHSANVVPWLAKLHPDWQFQPLHDMNESQVAEALAGSSIFLAFSDFEGCPVPPIEAALAGNIVIGYPGWGGLEYWKTPIFWSVPNGDLRAFVERFSEAAAWAPQVETLAMVGSARASLFDAYGVEAEATMLSDAVGSLLSIHPATALAA